MKLTEQQINTLMKHVLQLQEQPSFDNFNDVKKQNNATVDAKTRKQQVFSKIGLKPIPGLIGSYPEPVGKGLTQSQYIAQIIYSAKGAVDNEHNATQALLSIKDKKQFAETFRALKKLSGGQGIAQFISSFFGTYDNAYISLLASYKAIKGASDVGTTASAESLSNRNHWKTEARLRKIIAHLQKIGAWSTTINELQKTYKKIKQIAALEKKVWKSSYIKMGADFIKENYHEILLVLEILTSLITFPIGLIVSAGIGFVNAGLYATEGEYYEAGITAVFALMPAIGHLVPKIPQIAKLGAKGMERLGQKLLQKSGNLTKTEQLVAKGLIRSKDALKGIYERYMLTSAKNAEMGILAKAGLKSMLPKAIAGKPNPQLVAKVANLSAADKIVLMLSRGVMKASEFSLMMAAWTKGTDLVVKNVWDPIYKKYLANSEYEQALYKDLVGE